MLLISTASSPQNHTAMMKRPQKKTSPVIVKKTVITTKTTKVPSTPSRTKKPTKKAPAITTASEAPAVQPTAGPAPANPADNPATQAATAVPNPTTQPAAPANPADTTAETTPPATPASQEKSWYTSHWFKWAAYALLALITVVSFSKLLKSCTSSGPVPSVFQDNSTPANPANDATTPPPSVTPPTPPSFTPPLLPHGDIASSSTNVILSATTNITTTKEIPVFIPVTNYVPVMNTNPAAASFIINAGNNGIVTHSGGQTVIANSVVIEAPAVPIAPIQADSKYVNVNVGQKTVTIPSGKIALIRTLGVKVREIGGLPSSVRKMVDGMTPEEAVNTVTPSEVEYYNPSGETVEIKLKWGN